MEKQTKNYEIGFLTVSEDDIKEVTKELESHKATILTNGRPRRIHLAYPIKKETNAVFTYIQFAMDSLDVESFSSKLKLNTKILRFMVINLPAIAMRSEKERESEKPEEKGEKTERKEKAPEAVKKASSEDFVDNELLEKKLEEILK